jgi:hypothetical protein
MVKLKYAEIDPQSDKIYLLRNFKLAILYRPDQARFILDKFIKWLGLFLSIASLRVYFFNIVYVSLWGMIKLFSKYKYVLCFLKIIIKKENF